MADQRSVRPSTPPADLAALGAWIDGLIQELAAHPDPAVGERASALLDGVDALHRAALGRLVTLLATPSGAAVWSQAREDPVVRAVLLLYDLAQEGPDESESGALSEAPPPHPIVAIPVRHEPAPVPGKRALPLLPPGAAAAPRWREVASLDDLPPGSLRGFRVDGVAVLLGNVDGDVVAYEDACPDTPLALSVGQLDGGEIVCPWHGCRFEARSGRRTGHRGTWLRSFPVAVEGMAVRVATGVPGPVFMDRPRIAISNRS